MFSTMKGLRNARTARGVALLGGLVFAAQAWFYANQQKSILDEGAYLLKGLLFANRVYVPFQDYGPWTNHMPLAFIIPGVVQKWLGPGILTGRLFAIALGVLFLAGVWAVVRRMAGEWWAAGSVWVFALNPGLIKMYSVASSQSLVAAFVAWILFFALGRERKAWQVNVGVALAGVLLLTRINLSPVLPLLLVYVWWTHGARRGLGALLTAALVVGAGHALFWPGILKIWYHRLPDFVQGLLAAWAPPKTTPVWNPEVSLENRLISFFNGLGVHFIAMVGFALAWGLGWQNYWRQRDERFKEIVFLSVLFVVLFLAHAAAALGRNYCVFCFPVYLSFFQMLGVIVVAGYLSRPNPQISRWQSVLLVVALPLILGGIGYGVYSKIGRPLLAVPVPRVRALRFQPGTVALWGLLSNRFGYSYDFLLRALPAAAGFLMGVLIVLLAFAGCRLYARLKKQAAPQFANALFAAAMLFGLVFSPSLVLGGSYQTYDCPAGRVIETYQRVGGYLAETIPPGSKIFWQGSLSAVPLLYLESPQLFPPQINLAYSFRISEDDDALARYGLWNESLGRKWLLESDYALILAKSYDGWVQEAIETAGGFEELPPTPPLSLCEPADYLRVFKNTRANLMP